jgi:hypothetical protein
MAEGSCGGSTGLVGVKMHGWDLKHIVGVKTCHQKYLGESENTWVRVEICGWG